MHSDFSALLVQVGIFSQLWKTEKDTNDAILDTNSLTVQLLGSGLVDTITEANRQPPDVSMLII